MQYSPGIMRSIRRAGAAGALAILFAGAAAAQSDRLLLPDLLVTASRFGSGVTGASTTVISGEEIARFPGRTLQDILSAQPGVQMQTLYGGTGGARDVIDMRGFGAAATSNTLVLLNGRRLNDIDIAGVDFAAIPRDSIERIEIIRGGSGAVLYGDGAIGGVINIITKTGTGLPPALRIEGGVGSFGHREAGARAQAAAGPVSLWTGADLVESRGYRVNNALHQRRAVADVRYGTDRGSLYLALQADDQSLGLPGGRRVTPTTSELVTDRRGAATPFDRADKQGVSVTGGGTLLVAPGIELILDGSVRRKAQQASFFSAFGALFDSYVDTVLSTYAVTPRLRADYTLFGLPGRAIAGIDLYHSVYGSDRALHRGDAPNHRYDIRQTTLAVYGQNTVSLLPGTDLAAGIRVQRHAVSARDRLDPAAPGGIFAPPQGQPFDGDGWNHAYHLGLEQALTSWATVFGRLGRSFRLPNVDERIGQGPFGVATTFDLRPQVSRDYEAGLRLSGNGHVWQTSIYHMDLVDEIHFSPATFTNVNLDPTRRWGVESTASLRVSEALRLSAGLAYTRAVFRSGPFAGNDVPLVSRWTGTVGLSWTVWGEHLVLDALLRYVGPRRLDNDQANLQPRTPAYATVDLRLGGRIDRLHWSIAVENLLDAQYFNYGIASPCLSLPCAGLGIYNAYPMPGRTVLAKLGLALP